MHGKKKGISPVLATVVLIAMTMISAISIGGFVFGLFGNFSSNALVQAQYGSCSHDGSTCTLTLYNSGSANTSLNGGAACATVKYNGVTVAATSCVGAPSNTVTAGGSVITTVTFGSNFNAVPGQQVTGSVYLGNGAIVLFSGTFT